MLATAAQLAPLFHPIDEIRFVDQRASHRHAFESAVEHHVDLFTRHEAADIDQRQFQRFAEVLERKKGVAEFYDHDLGTETTG